MTRLERKNYNMILTEKQPKEQPYHQTKSVNMNISLDKKYYHLITNIAGQAKFTYFPLEKAFEKQIKTIEDQGKKQVEVLKELKPKEQTKAIESKSDNKNYQSIAANIFNDLIKKRKSIMNELYVSVDKNKLHFEY